MDCNIVFLLFYMLFNFAMFANSQMRCGYFPIFLYLGHACAVRVMRMTMTRIELYDLYYTYGVNILVGVTGKG